MILRKLGDHTDLTTYYVRAVVRNSISGEIIETINLIDSGSNSRRFYKLYEVPSDISGQGFYIDIETSVYSDSGYTTKASTYTDDLEQYLVFDRMPKSSGGGGVDVDYKKIEKILAEMMKPLSGLKNIDLAPVLTQIKGVMNDVRAIKIPKPEKVDHTPVLEAIRSSVKDIIKSIIEKPVTPVTELAGLEAKILDSINKKEPNLEQVFKYFTKIEKLINTHMEEYASREGAKEKLAEIKEALGGVFRGEDFKPKPMGPKKDERIIKLLGGKKDE